MGELEVVLGRAPPVQMIRAFHRRPKLPHAWIVVACNLFTEEFSQSQVVSVSTQLSS